MTFTDEQSFRLHIKNEPCRRLYFLYGEEDYLKRQYIDRLVQKAAPDAAAGFNYMPFDGKVTDVDTICDAATALPLFAAQKCVYVADFNAEQYAESDFARLCELVEDIPDTTVLLFCTLSQDIGGKKSLSAKWKRFVKLAGEVGVVVELCTRTEQDLTRYARAYAEKQGAQLDGAAAKLLCERSRYKMELLVSDLNRLTAYRQGGEITVQDIELMCEKEPDAMAYELAGAVASGDGTKALKLIEAYRAKREEPVAILAALSSGHIDFYRAKLGAQAGKDGKAVFADFGYKGNPNRFYYVQKDAARLSTRYLSGALDVLVACDCELKSSKADGYVLLEQAVMRLLILRANEGKS